MVASISLLPQASAHTPAWNIPTYAFINVAPNPIGVGQRAVIIIWLDKLYGPDAGLGNNYRFHNYNLTITAPDGTVTQQIFATVTDPTSAQFTFFSPAQVGTYTFNFSFPGQLYNQYAGGFNPTSVLVNDTFLPASASATLVVQQEPIPSTSSPLPTEYWTQPIYGQNPNWWTISSNWLGSGSPVEASVGSGAIVFMVQTVYFQVQPLTEIQVTLAVLKLAMLCGQSNCKLAESLAEITLQFRETATSKVQLTFKDTPTQ